MPSRRSLLLTPLAFPLFIVSAHDTVDLLTDGTPNGRYWRLMNETAQGSMTWGLLLGAQIFEDVLSSLTDKPDQKKFYEDTMNRFVNVPHSSIGDVAKEISTLYDDPLNVPIPIDEIVIRAISLFKGDLTPEQLQKELTQLRKTYSQ